MSTNRNPKITRLIRTINFMLNSKLKHAKLVRMVKANNKPILAKVRNEFIAAGRNPDGDWNFVHDVHQKASKDPNYLPYPKWADGKKAKIDFGISEYITALHIAYLRLRDSKKGHTEDDDKWIENNSWSYSKITSALAEAYEIPEDAFENVGAADVA